MERHVRTQFGWALLATTAIGAALLPTGASAQGCEPIRFTAPVFLGGEGQAYQPAREWQLMFGYRRLFSNQWFIGTKESSDKGPGGRSPVFKIHTFVAGVAYSFNDRYRLGLSVPFSKGSFTRGGWADGAVHEQNASGIGDVSLVGEAWVLNPRTHERGNLSIGLGVKAPTGSHTVGDRFYLKTEAVDYPADQTIQPGDGGWAVLVQAQGFRQITERTYGYAFGSYMANPKSKSDIATAPTSGVYWSVPDVYSARLGGAFSVLPNHGLSASLGGRMDGIPVHDLLGSGDETTVKRSAFVVYADPGLSLTWGKGTLTGSVPYRLLVNRQKSVLEQSTNGLNAGGFAKYLVFLGYTYRL
jgi:hypothetical protein